MAKDSFNEPNKKSRHTFSLKLQPPDDDMFDRDTSDTSEYSTAKKKKKSKKEKKKKKSSWITDYYEPSLHGIHPLDFTRQLMLNQASIRAGGNIPDWMLLDTHQDSGFHFGVKRGLKGYYIGKPQDKDGHVLVVGGPGSGKTRDIVIPTLYTWRGHTVVFDIKTKGDLLDHCISASRLAMKRVMVFSPAEEGGLGYDPYAFLRFDGDHNLPRNARDLALALLPLSQSDRDKVWRRSAQSLLTAAIIYYFELGASFSETMTAVQYYSAKELIDEIEGSNNTAAKLSVRKLKGLSRKVLANVDMDLTEMAIFATDSLIASALCSSEDSEVIDWNDLNTATTPCTIVLHLPEENLEVWAPMTKLLFNQLIRTLQRRDEKYSVAGRNLQPVLIMCEEFSALGEIPSIISGLATLRSRNVTFCLIVQSFSQFDMTYGEAARRAIVDTCSYKAILHTSDPECQKYLSDMIGTLPVASRSVSASYNSVTGESGNYNPRVGESREPIVFPHELNSLGDEIVLITPNGFCRIDKLSSMLRQPRPIETPRLTYGYN